MVRWRLVVFILMLLGVSGCTAYQVAAPPAVPGVKVMQEDMGWVRVEVSGVTTPGYTLTWGDVETSYGFSPVLPRDESYEHMYQKPGEYTIALLDSNKKVAGQATVYVFSVDCHVSLLAIEGRTITVRYFGRYGVGYTIVWGDRYADEITAMTGTGILSHTYHASGTYAVGMGETWAPARIFFKVTVK